MSTFFKTLPTELVTNVTAICGERGTAWVDGLPEAIARLEEKWQLVVHDPFPAIEFNFVAPATMSTGEASVVKIAPPYEEAEIFCEAKYLATRNGDGCVRLLEIDRELPAILIERLFPGENLAQAFADNEPACVEPAIQVLQKITRPPPEDTTDTIDLDYWFAGLQRYTSTEFPATYAEKALAIYSDLSKRRSGRCYLHGDFHPANVVTATREPYLAIDPKGIVGDLGYDIAVFLNNLHWWQESRHDVRQRLATAIGQFSEAFAIDLLELRQWAFTQMVLSAWWTYDEMPGIYRNEVVKADIWDV